MHFQHAEVPSAAERNAGKSQNHGLPSVPRAPNRTVDPEVIGAMGKPAASWFFPDLKTLNPYRGKVHNLTVQGKPRKVIVTYHPSYLLRSPQEKRKAWLDWCLILDTLS